MVDTDRLVKTYDIAITVMKIWHILFVEFGDFLFGNPTGKTVFNLSSSALK